MDEATPELRSEVERWNFDTAESMRQVWPVAWFEAVGAGSFTATVRRRVFDEMLLEGIEASPYRCQRTSLDVAAYPSDSMSINVVLQGAVVMRERGGEYRAEAGDVFVHRNQAFSFECSSPSRTFRAVVHPRLMPPILGIDQPLGLCPSSTLTRAYARFGEEILASTDTSKKGPTDPSLEQSALTLQRGLVTAVLQQHRRAPRTLEQLRREVLEYVEQRFTDPGFGVEQLTNDFKISRRWLFRAFEGEPESLSAHIRRRRVERATTDLEQHPEVTVQEIGRRNGFTGRDLFTRAFRENYGHSPAEHRASR